ncbi:MAG: formylglycine-generating enzyme family protein [Saprospiraceae bacterium]|nr:formylglycine-generating enzyme family protein [Saprospiraceae bacterium]
MKTVRAMFVMSLICNTPILIAQDDTVLAQQQVKASTESTSSNLNSPYLEVEGGYFRLGSHDAHAAVDEFPIKKIAVPSLVVGRYEVTFTEFDLFCESTGHPKPDDAGWGRDNRPVMNVDWYLAIQYCNWLSEKEGFTPCYAITKAKACEITGFYNGEEDWKVTCNWEADGYRLPTEAEWEYIARGGKKAKRSLFAGSNTIEEVGWYAENSEDMTHPVGSKQANELGAHDMSGNVWEWCWDWYAAKAYKDIETFGPTGPETGKLKSMRGGACDNDTGMYLRVSNRGYLDPEVGYPCLGFRVVRLLLDKQSQGSRF